MIKILKSIYDGINWFIDNFGEIAGYFFLAFFAFEVLWLIYMLGQVFIFDNWGLGY